MRSASSKRSTSKPHPRFVSMASGESTPANLEWASFIHQPIPHKPGDTASRTGFANSLPTPSSTPSPTPKSFGSCLDIDRLGYNDVDCADSGALGRALTVLPPYGAGYNLVTLRREEDDESILSVQTFDRSDLRNACAHMRSCLDSSEITGTESIKVAKPQPPRSTLAYLTPPSSPETEPIRTSANDVDIDTMALDTESSAPPDNNLDDLPSFHHVEDPPHQILSYSPPSVRAKTSDFTCDERDGLEGDGNSPNARLIHADRETQETFPSADLITNLRNLTSSPISVPNLTASLDLSSFPEWPVARGGYGEVWKGCINHEPEYRHAKLVDDRRRPKVKRNAVAIKRLTTYTDAGEAGIRKTLKRTAREIYVWSHLRHCNVLPLLGFCHFRGGIGIVSPWQEAGNATAWVNSNPNVDRLALCQGVCAGLAYLHDNDVVHGDLRGANVLISPRGTSRLIDFGLATIVGGIPAFSASSATAGTVRWMAPELQVAESHGVTKASDIFALGMTILELYTGACPFSDIGNDVAVLLKYQHGERPVRPTSVQPNIEVGGNRNSTSTRAEMDDHIWSLVQRCWHQDPEQRPSARDVLLQIGRSVKLTDCQSI